MSDTLSSSSEFNQQAARKRRARWALMGMVILFVGLVLVFSRVLKMRLSTGDIYPHYSSLRSDPLGTMALYESFQRMPDVAVERNFRPAADIEGIDGDTTVLLLGVPRASLVWLISAGRMRFCTRWLTVRGW